MSCRTVDHQKGKNREKEYREQSSDDLLIRYLASPWWREKYINGGITNYLLNNNLTETGVVFVVERIETAKQLAEEFGSYTFQHYGIEIDVPFYKPHTAAYALESAFTTEVCIKDINEFQLRICSGCSEVNTCPIPRKYPIQKEYPFVILAHTCLEMDMDKLKKSILLLGRKRNLILSIKHARS